MKKKKIGSSKKGKTTPVASTEAEQGDLLGDDDGPNTTELKVSETFARKYNSKKDKEELARANRVLAQEGDGSESTESEDELAELLTTKVDNKIFDTLAKIKRKDPTIYDGKHAFFEDKDFEGAKAAAAESSSSSGGGKKVMYKDFVRNTLLADGADAINKEEEALEARGRAEKDAGKKGKKKGLLTPLEEQKQIKAQILAAAADDDDDDDFVFTLKAKAPEEIQKEEEEFRDFNIQKDKEPRGDEEGDDIVTRYWKPDEDLDEGERFLRDYLLNKGWQETTSLQEEHSGPFSSAAAAADGPADSEEEDEHLDDVDEFEKDYNFRFEVEGGSQIQGHARVQESSVREKPDKRKRQRKEKAERKGEEKIRRTEELKRLKNIKKEEIRRRLQELQQITGNADCALGAIDLDADFDPDTHDQEVGKVLGDGFDALEEELAEEDLIQGKGDLDVSGAAEEVIERRRSRGKKKGVEEEVDGDDNDWEPEAADDADAGAEEEPEPGLWFRCDQCQKPILGGKKRFDCTVCEDYILCAKCFRVRRHPHKFVRRKVPERCVPPEDVPGLDADGQKAAVEEVLDEYFQMDYEDIIGGDLPTRFKYRKVDSADFGLRPVDILEKTDAELNRVVPLKKLRTYRGDQNVGARAWSASGGSRDEERWARKRQNAAQAAWESPKAPKPGGISDQRLSAYSMSSGSGGGGKKHRKA